MTVVTRPSLFVTAAARTRVINVATPYPRSPERGRTEDNPPSGGGRCNGRTSTQDVCQQRWASSSRTAHTENSTEFRCFLRESRVGAREVTCPLQAGQAGPAGSCRPLQRHAVRAGFISCRLQCVRSDAAGRRGSSWDAADSRGCRGRLARHCQRRDSARDDSRTDHPKWHRLRQRSRSSGLASRPR